MLAVLAASAALGAGLACGRVSDASAGQYARVSDDLSLCYEDVGQGDPLVMIPGWTTSEVVFSHQIDHFAKTHRVIAYDPRSQGLSTRTLEHNTYAQHGRDLAALMDKLNLKHVTLIAWSAGCLDAYAYIRDRGIGNSQPSCASGNPAHGLTTQAGDWAMAQADDKGLTTHGVLHGAGARQFWPAPPACPPFEI
jgi:pimeloyl-ACP methyl ester carboxylesterase